MAQAKPLNPRDFAAALDWWQDAGVDCDFADDATDWLAEPEAEKTPQPAAQSGGAAAPVAKPAAPEKIDLFAGTPPSDLAAFHDWWLTAPGLDPIGPRGRVAPRGNPDADLMVLVTDPEENDAEKLLSGPQGRLLDRMLAAMGFGEQDFYLASALPRHMPLAEGSAMADAGYHEVLMHHIALKAPHKIIAFGANILPLLGHNAAQGTKPLREINHERGRVPLLVSEGLDSLMAMPRLKARFWRRWLEWTDD